MVPVRSVTVASLQTAIASEQIEHSTTRPTESLSGEVRRLGVNMEDDAVALEAKGLSKDFMATSEPLALALEQSDSSWTMAHFGDTNILSQWTALKPGGIVARDELYDHLDAAFCDNPEKMTALVAIGESDVNEELLIEISRLVKLGRENLSLLQSVGYDAAKLDSTEAIGHQLSAIYAQSRPGSDPKEEKILLEQTKNFAMRWIKTVRKFGKLANRDNPERQQAYHDPYSRTKYLKQVAAKKKADAASTAPKTSTWP